MDFVSLKRSVTSVCSVPTLAWRFIRLRVDRKQALLALDFPADDFCDQVEFLHALDLDPGVQELKLIAEVVRREFNASRACLRSTRSR